MKSILLVAMAVALGICTISDAQDKEKSVPIDQFERIRDLLNGTQIETKDFQTEMPLSKFLPALEAKLPTNAKLGIRLDEAAFGSDAPRIAGAGVRNRIPLPKLALGTLLDDLIKQVSSKNEVAFGIRDGGLIFTRPRLAAHTAIYDVRNLLGRPELLRSVTELNQQEFLLEPKQTGGIESLTHVLANTAHLEPWETIEILNGTRISLHASFRHHEAADDLLDQLRKMADLGVHMNARLYEVDRAFFAKQIEPLLAPDPKTGKRPVAVAIKAPLLKLIVRQKLLLQSDETKLVPCRPATFLASHHVFRYDAGPEPGGHDRRVIGTGETGFSFEVVPIVSADQRYLRLHILQKRSSLVKLEKRTNRDAKTGKESSLEVPTMAKSEVRGMVQIADRTPILMPVEGSNDKVQLIVAVPVIWIEAEMKEWSEGRKMIRPQEWGWEIDFDKLGVEPAATPKIQRLQLTDDVKELLQAVVNDVLTNPELKSSRDFYGTAKDKTLILSDQGIGWPKEFNPSTHGLRVIQPDPFDYPRRVLGIRIDKFDPKQKRRDMYSAPIEVALFNAGGSANGGVIGAMFVYYAPKRVGEHWTVEFIGGWDP